MRAFQRLWSLLVFILTPSSIHTNGDLPSIFKEIGFSSYCVSKCFAICENSSGEGSAPNKTHTSTPWFNARPRNCADLYAMGDTQSGVRTIYPLSCCENRAVYAFCDQVTDGGGWTVIQHRENIPVREDFYRSWLEYELGFGQTDKEFWLGLQNIRALTSTQLMELRVDLEDYEGEKRWAKYQHFYIADETDKYRLNLGAYSGNAQDSLTDYHNNQKFSAKDNDNDKDSGNCAEKYKGAWWYSNCHASNLNGYQYQGDHKSYADGINWTGFRGHHHSMKITSLSVRPKFYPKV